MAKMGKEVYALGRKEKTLEGIGNRTETTDKGTILTKSCPGFLSCNIMLSFVGLNYIIMGQVEEDGRGKVFPNSFVMSFKTKNSKILNALKNKTC